MAVLRLRRMQSAKSGNREYLGCLGRAAAGALIFSLPLLMTMEMWQLGAHIDRSKLALFLAVIALMVFGLSRFAGFRHTTTVIDDLLDALAALLVGFVVAALLLGLMGLLGPSQGLRTIVGMIAVQAAPASFGAVLANKQLSASGSDEPEQERAGYLGQLFLMTAGALFFAFNVAPTEEMILIGFKMTSAHALLMIAAALLALHALVFTVGFAGREKAERPLLAFLHFTVVGYGIALVVSLYVLWTFERLGPSVGETLHSVIVLGFPAAIGAAVARLVV